MFKYKQIIVVREDLGMSPGKLAVQVAHGAVASAERTRKNQSEWFSEWVKEGQKKVVVVVPNEDEIRELHDKTRSLGVPHEIIQDAGLTELPPGAVTVLAIGPAPNNVVDKITKKLPLL